MSKLSITQVLKQAEALCQERGLQLTEQRKKVLQLLCEAQKPLSAYELLERMRDVVKSPAPPTVYRALDFLLEQGLVHKIESLRAYVSCTHSDQPHACQFLICDRCGDVAELDDPNIASDLSAVGEASGFRTKRPVVELLGTCARCLANHDDLS